MTIDELKEIIDATAGGSQAKFALLIRKSPSQVNQWLSGIKTVGPKIERDIAEAIGYHKMPKSFRQPPAPAPDGYTTFDLLDLSASAGPGAVATDTPEVLQRVNVLESWALRELGGGDLSRIKLITARGDSMNGTIADRDVLFVDANVQEYAGEGVYVIAAGGEVQVKRLQRLISGGLRVISDNAVRYPAQDLTQEAALAQLRVCGRVLGAWSLRTFG
jgi:DNA-binding transcriptional regulator YdaS (Cro superfamily)